MIEKDKIIRHFSNYNIGKFVFETYVNNDKINWNKIKNDISHRRITVLEQAKEKIEIAREKPLDIQLGFFNMFGDELFKDAYLSSNNEPDTYVQLKMQHIDNKLDGRQAISEYLINKHHFLSILGEKNDEVYNYEDGIYVQKGVAVIKEETEQILEETSSTVSTNEIINKIKRMTRIDREEFDKTPKNLICLNNGIYNIKTDEFIQHSAKHKFLAKIKTNFVKDATCPNIMKVLKELVDNDTLLVLQELAGYCLLRSNKYKKAFIIEGPGDSGKTTFLKLLEAMIGINNIAVSSLQYLCDDKNGTATLYGKLCNFYDDLSFTSIRNPGKLKLLTGNFYVPAEKKYHDQFQFLNDATLCFTCNKIPDVKNADGAYYGRFILCLFHNIIPKEKQDRDLLDKLLCEMPGFLNWALEGLKRLEQQNKFSYKWTDEDVKEYMHKSCSSIASFVQKCLIESNGNYLTRDQLYTAYVDFCQENSISGDEQKTKRTLGTYFLRYCDYAQDSRKDLPGHKNTRIWKNVALRQKELGFQENEVYDYKSS